ncbi:FecR family protein [Snuella sedimenti]|uniref:DUF4974 domain-containing protein n=1 Tax=Snuella sedimenti TaxID=2798802 RepID=A0A8J7JB24_9FLAO|nr:FecR family protein [Snuella sedimenti]MBJ6367789.1 DUF4974 domain-containing protein [Snuella sedimenti]
MNDIFQISRLIIKKKLKVLSATGKEQLKQFRKTYPFVKDVDFESFADKISEYNTIDKDNAWDEVLLKAQKKQTKTGVVIFKKPWFKYAAAASVALMVTLTIFLNKESETERIEPIIVNINNIEIGTDKATLTLANGANVALEKGTSYQDDNVSSNGEALVYVSKKKANKAVEYNYLTIPRGGQFFMTLSDGTKVWLNSESQLKYPVSFTEGKLREVELVYGEAYFEVSPSSAHKGAGFKVLNNKQEIQVLGTQFNVKAYKDESHVYTTLVEGKVAVSFEGNKQNLIPNQQSNLDLETKNISVATVDVYNEISWKEGVFSFDEKSLKDIMRVLARWYDMEVVFKNPELEKEEFNGMLGKDQKIEEILASIKNFGKITAYEIQDKKLILE